MTTMLRCALLLRRPCGLLLLTAAALGGLFGSDSATAQGPVRSFAATALRGELVVTQAPEILLNQRPARLAPGARIRGTDNLLLLSGAITGQRLLVHYTRDVLGQVLDVWVLTPAEAARRPWPTTPEQAQAWVFNPDAQTWSTR
jgi:hypothetical protein